MRIRPFSCRLQFDGSTESADAGDVVALRFGISDPWTLVTEFMGNTAAVTQTLVSKIASSQGWRITMLANGQIVFGMFASGGNLEVRTVASGFDGSAHKLVVTYDGSTNASGVNVIIDGSNQSLTTLQDTLAGTFGASPFRLASQGAPAWNGWISDMVILSGNTTAAKATTWHGCAQGTWPSTVLSLPTVWHGAAGGFDGADIPDIQDGKHATGVGLDGSNLEPNTFV